MQEGPLHRLDRRQRRITLARSLLRVLLMSVVLVVVYAFVPVAGRTGPMELVRLAVGLLVFVAVVAWQLRSVASAEYPQLRAAEALAIAFVLLVLAFAFAYLSMSHGDRGSFNEHLDRIGALYFALSVITTVGFGDIVARAHLARIVVMAQFILDLALIFGVVRLFIGAAERAQRERDLSEVREDR